MPRLPYQASLSALLLGLFLWAAPPAHATIGINPDGSLDKPTISKAYFEGEFWTVITALEAYRKAGMRGDRPDSVYTFKYLSVVYAADPTTRKKAESYMYQLIKMMPTIDLIDLYISDNIESIFKKVKSEYEKLEKVQTDGSPGETTASRDSAATGSGAVAATPPEEPGAGKAAARDATSKAETYPSAPEQPAKGKERNRPGIKPWVPLAIGGLCVATATFFLVTLGSGSDDGSETPRPMQVTVVTPNQGSQ